jgi:hypothetical protein
MVGKLSLTSFNRYSTLHFCGENSNIGNLNVTDISHYYSFVCIFSVFLLPLRNRTQDTDFSTLMLKTTHSSHGMAPGILYHFSLLHHKWLVKDLFHDFCSSFFLLSIIMNIIL